MTKLVAFIGAASLALAVSAHANAQTPAQISQGDTAGATSRAAKSCISSTAVTRAMATPARTALGLGSCRRGCPSQPSRPISAVRVRCRLTRPRWCRTRKRRISSPTCRRFHGHLPRRTSRSSARSSARSEDPALPPVPRWKFDARCSWCGLEIETVTASIRR